MWSNYVRASTVRNSTFEWLGGNGVLAMGTDKMGDATDGNHPFNNTIDTCCFREVGVFAKHSGAYAEFVAGRVTLSNNIAYNGPRAAIALNDGMGGGSDIHHNLLFNMVRESGDHGPINSWDRQSFLTAHGSAPSCNYSTTEIHRNFIMAGNDGAWFPIDHDDGSAEYFDHHNFLLFGGHKNYLGHSKRFAHNVQVWPDFGRSSPTRVSCVDFDTGHDEFYHDNTCILRGHPAHYWCDGNSNCSVVSLRNVCPGDLTNISNPQLHALQAANNTYYVPHGGQGGSAVWWDGGDGRCTSANAAQSIRLVQRNAGETGSEVKDVGTLSLQAIVAMGEAVLSD